MGEQLDECQYLDLAEERELVASSSVRIDSVAWHKSINSGTIRRLIITLVTGYLTVLA